MSQKSSIEWTEKTWNPMTGCTKVTAGCQHCYAKTFAERFRGVPGHPYEQGFDLKLWPQRLDQPLNIKKSTTFFVNSMSDMFQKEIPLDFIKEVFATMLQASQHQFQVLTKRSERLPEVSSQLPWSKNIWMGVSVENMDNTHRIDDLRNTGAAIKFLSLEPLLGPLPNLNLKGIHWVIVGGESGAKARPMDMDWVRDLRDQSLQANIPFFFKQIGGKNKKKAGRLLDGRTWDEMPNVTS